MATARKGFEEILLDRSWVSPADLKKARQRKKPGQELGEVLVNMGVVEPQRLARAMAQEYWLPFQAHINVHTLESDLVAKVPINYAKKNHLLPLGSNGAAITVAIADPANYEALDDLHVLFGRTIRTVVAPVEVISEAINRAYDQASNTSAQDLMIDLEEERLDLVASELASEPRDLLEADDAAPIIKLVNGLLHRRSRTAPATSTSKCSSGISWSASAWTGCCLTCSRHPSGFTPRSPRASRSCLV